MARPGARCYVVLAVGLVQERFAPLRRLLLLLGLVTVVMSMTIVYRRRRVGWEAGGDERQRPSTACAAAASDLGRAEKASFDVEPTETSRRHGRSQNIQRYNVISSYRVCVASSEKCLLRPRERLRSIVMSMSVCLSVCPRGYLPNHTRDLYRGSVLLRHGEDRPHRLSAGRGDGSAQRWRSVIYDCLVIVTVISLSFAL